MRSLEQALEEILSRVQPLPHEDINVWGGPGRILAETILAGNDLPPFDNSAMDGYALRAEDLRLASPENPAALHLAGKISAGRRPSAPVAPGACFRIFTGSPMPRGADAVVMQEDAEPSGEAQVLFREPIKPFENVRLRGEDVKNGAPLAEPGDRVSPTAAALFAGCGYSLLRVSEQPRAALLATGSELAEPGGWPLMPGEIYETNRLLLSSLLRPAGVDAEIHRLVPDTLEETESRLDGAFQSAHAVITTGGVSVGEYDLVKEALARLGGKVDFWRVAIKPGKPFVFGACRGKPFFGLPGNPVSAMVTALLLVRPALLKMQGARHLELPRAQGRLAEPLSNPGGRRHFLRVRLSSSGEIHQAGPQASHRLGSLAGANGLVDLAPGQTLAAGETASVLLWDFPSPI